MKAYLREHWPNIVSFVVIFGAIWLYQWYFNGEFTFLALIMFFAFGCIFRMIIDKTFWLLFRYKFTEFKYEVVIKDISLNTIDDLLTLDKELNNLVKKIDERYRWLKENLEPLTYKTEYIKQEDKTIFRFLKEEDATLFKLIWLE